MSHSTNKKRAARFRTLNDSVQSTVLGAMYDWVTDQITRRFVDTGVELMPTEVKAIRVWVEESEEDTFPVIYRESETERAISIDLRSIPIAETSDRLIERLPDIIENMIKEGAPDFVQRLKLDWPAQASFQTESTGVFRERLAARWAEPFALLGMLTTVSREIGEHVLAAHHEDSPEDRPILFDVATRLHARACQVAEEIRTLLSAGFADGAMARWRTLHEIAVTTMFLVDHGEPAAERFLLHQVVDEYGLLGARKAHPHILREPVDQEEFATIRQEVESLRARFGADFDDWYGWAAPWVKGRPTFAAIEAAIDLAHWRADYKIASENIHSASRAAFYKLGLIDASVLLTGPSNIGLHTPGQCTAISLLQITAAINLLAVSVDTALALQAMLLLCDEAQAAFVGVQESILSDR